MEKNTTPLTCPRDFGPMFMSETGSPERCASQVYGRANGGDHPRDDRDAAAAVAKHHGVSETIDARKKRFGGLRAERRSPLEAARARERAAEEAGAERDLELEVMKEIQLKKWRACRRAASKRPTGRGLSVRRACPLVRAGRSALGHRSKKAAKDVPATARMKELPAQYPRYGYRRIKIFLGRGDHRMSPAGAPSVPGGRAATAAAPAT